MKRDTKSRWIPRPDDAAGGTGCTFQRDFLLSKMKREINGSHSVAFTVINDLGEVTSEIDTPSNIKSEINRAIGRQQRAGVVYGGGQRWSWSTVSLGDETDVVLEFERGGHVVERYEIPWQSWEGFKIVSARQGKSARDYLTILLGCGMAEGETVGEMIHWLFALPSEPAPEVTRFEQAQREFHGEEVVV